jgi:polyisoprenoid-binding protein YceI
MRPTPRPRAQPTTVTAAPDPYLAACGDTSRSTALAPAGRWSIADGSLAGFRVHERFLQIQTPNEAVARTAQVAGAMILTGAASSLTVSKACVAVSTTSLHSVDRVPFMDTRDRDGWFPDVLESRDYPVALFRTSDVTLPTETASGRKVTVPVSGQLTMHGVTRTVTLALEGTLNGDQVQLAGGFPIQLADYGMSFPENPVAEVEQTVTIEFQLFLDRA